MLSSRGEQLLCQTAVTAYSTNKYYYILTLQISTSVCLWVAVCQRVACKVSSSQKTSATANADTVMGQRLRWWPNIWPTQDETINSIQHFPLRVNWSALLIRENLLDSERWSTSTMVPYFCTSYWSSDWSRLPSRPIRSLRYIATCTWIHFC